MKGFLAAARGCTSACGANSTAAQARADELNAHIAKLRQEHE
ncbi:hypothetical protein [Streptomyces sp. NBC_01538]